MATNRYISTSFWDDEWIQTLDPSEKLLYLYYMTNPLTNIAGIYKVTQRRVSFDTGFTNDTIGHIMAKFEKAGKVFRFQEWVILPNWTKYQKVGEKDNNRKGIDAILKVIPDNIYEYAIKSGYKYQFLEDLGRPLQGGSTTLNYLNLNLNLNSNLNLCNADQRSSQSEEVENSKIEGICRGSEVLLVDHSPEIEETTPARRLPVPEDSLPVALKPKKENWYKNENNARAFKYIKEYITDYDPNYYFGDIEKSTIKNLVNRLRVEDKEGNKVFDHEYFAEKWENYTKPSFWMDRGCKNIMSFYKNINRIPV